MCIMMIVKQVMLKIHFRLQDVLALLIKQTAMSFKFTVDRHYSFDTTRIAPVDSVPAHSADVRSLIYDQLEQAR
jgi:hypothetical protein